MNKYNCIRWIGVSIVILGIILTLFSLFDVASLFPENFLKYRTGITAVGMLLALFGKWKLDKEKKKP